MPFNIRLPSSGFKWRAVEYEATLGGKDHLVECKDVNGAVRLPGDFIGHAFGKCIHILTEDVNGGKDLRVEDITENQEVGRLTFIGKAMTDFIHTDGKVGPLIEEIFYCKVTFKLRHSISSWHGKQQGKNSDDGGCFPLT